MNSNTPISKDTYIAKPGCQSKCGNLTVPYPFGIGLNSGCSISPFFDINCNTSFDPPKAFLHISDDIEVISISDSKVQIRNQLAWNCYSSDTVTGDNELRINLTATPFSLSSENKLTVVGCDDYSLATLNTSLNQGIGCCKASIPRGLQYIYVGLSSLRNHGNVTSFNPCSYSFIGDGSRYTFQVSDVSDSSPANKIIETVPLLLDWVVGNQSCYQLQNTTGVCQGASVCVDSGTNIKGYRCNCTRGYEGNPYLSPGCQDINECEYNPCSDKAICTNLPGSYNCSCPYSYVGDGRKDGIGCVYLNLPKRNVARTGLAAGSGLLIILVLATSFWLYKVLKKRKLKRRRQMFFKRNGGLLLQQQISAGDHELQKIRFFTAKELEKATDRFNERRILGCGGQGTVYKGMLFDGRIVAVKMSKKVDENQLEEFINEVFILSQINHRNVVKLLGCCLETEVPLLAYEFISNGTLYDLIHDDTAGFPFSWDMRLRIATEVASPLAYLHSATSIPIFHRDIKSSNILLDEKYRAKVSDFGISRLVSMDQTHLTTKVKGTFGYVDPEYFQTSKFTEKSDVYSFGVILVELLTGQKPLSTSETEEERSSVKRFILTMEENKLQTVLDPKILDQGITDEQLSVANLALRCLNLHGKKRPSMRDVASELESINTRENPSFVELEDQEMMGVETESIDFSDEESIWK
ncbi:putative wall-associated receptor kinase-like 11 isoform X2 [Henckelia pumila]|uniref:putative wall-associated receptor kinase-like 11 isoform X2 n=1 Tax=Henckelia pumila TaxID=405737 RepID=UPI003C6E9FC6